MKTIVRVLCVTGAVSVVLLISAFFVAMEMTWIHGVRVKINDVKSSLKNIESTDSAAGISSLNEKTQAAPRDPNLYHRLAIAYHLKGDYTKAVSNYQEAARLRDTDPLVHSNMALALSAAGRNEEAVEQYKKSIGLAGLPATHVKLAIVYDAMGKTEEADGEYDEALRMDPNSPFAHYWHAKSLEKKQMAREAFDEMILAMKLMKEENENDKGADTLEKLANQRPEMPK